ncbi:MAG: 2-dehydropantoate 2-reductase [Deltaproteobacteria bacterium]|nr:2-dehydropantoate 2-reductase [Deltaproteobacteria bacterium]
MRTAIIGIGGVGGFYGGKLSRYYERSPEHEVFFIARGTHLDTIRKEGLTLITPSERFVTRPARATDRTEELGSLDLVLVCVKEYGLDEAARMLIPAIQETTVVIPLLNGVDNVERLGRLLPWGTLLNGCVYISSHLEGPGIVSQKGGSAKLFFGPEDTGGKAYGYIEDFLRNAGIDATLAAPVTTEVWTKFIFIGPVAAVTALHRLTLGDLERSEEHRHLLEGMMREVEEIARAKAIALPSNIVQGSLQKVSAFPPGTKTSLLVDREQGRPLELETFVGYIVRAGQALGIETPLHDTVYAAFTDPARAIL